MRTDLMPGMRAGCVAALLLFSMLPAHAADSPAAPPAAPLPFGVAFVEGSATSVIIEKDGKRYLVDAAARSIREVDAKSASTPAQEGSVSSSAQASSSAQQNPQSATANPADANATTSYYRPGDDRLLVLPTGQHIARHAVWVNFNHRFAYKPTFSTAAQGHTLLGLDGFGVASFGVQFGLTDRWSVAAYRSPSNIGRPIELRTAYELTSERDGQPLNLMFRFSVDGQNDFQRNFTTNFELIASRSITNRAQLVLVPTVSLHNRPVLSELTSEEFPPLEQPCSQPLANGVPASMNVKPCADTFSLGVGLAVDVRPTVALIGEVNPTLVNATDIGIHRPPFSFAIQKKIWRHAFTFGFTTAPGTTVAQRSGTRSTFLRDPHGDTPKALFVAFNLSRQLH